MAVGDQLVRHPRPGLEIRTEPWATREELRMMLKRHPKLQGIVKARQAAELIRAGADSAPETFLRLALTAAGLPEPELQLRLVPEDPYSPAADLGYREQRIAIQYDGAHHRTREQQSRDNRRDEVFNAAGWRYFKFNADDLANDFRGAVRRVRIALRSPLNARCPITYGCFAAGMTAIGDRATRGMGNAEGRAPGTSASAGSVPAGPHPRW